MGAPGELTAGSCDQPLVRAFQFLGKRWNGLLLATLDDGPTGFAELKRSLGISESVLADRLTELSRGGLIRRVVHEGPPLGVTYQLTSSGQALVPVLSQLSVWADAHLDSDACARAIAREDASAHRGPVGGARAQPVGERTQ